MARVLVLVDHHGGRPIRTTRELITLAQSMGTPTPVWLGEVTPQGVASLAGVDTILHPHPRDERDAQEHPAAVVAEGIVAAIQWCQQNNEQPLAVLLTSTTENKEIATRIAHATDSGVVVDATSVTYKDGVAEVTQSVYGGTHRVTSQVKGTTPVIVIESRTTEPHDDPNAPEPNVVDLVFEPSDLARLTTVTQRGEEETDMTLAEADCVVVGGRGVQGDFSLIRDLAHVLGGMVGATQVAADEGWIERSAQVGQSGVTISPRLYVSAGVSGAIHHTTGMRTSETIVAIDVDPSAPIFEIADFGVVGDLTTVIPGLISEIEELRRASS